MGDLELGMALGLRQLLGLDDGLARTLRESVRAHQCVRSRGSGCGCAARIGSSCCRASSSSVGRTTRVVTIRSPFCDEPRFGSPRPLMRISWPFWVFGRIRSFTLPVGVETGTSAPRMRLGQRQRQLGVEIGARALEAAIRLDRDVDDEIAAVHGPGQLDLRAIAYAGRDLHVEAAAVDAHHALGASGNLRERDLRGGLRQWPGLHPCAAAEVGEVDVLEPAGRAAAAERGAASLGFAEELAEEVAEAAQVLGRAGAVCPARSARCAAEAGPVGRAAGPEAGVLVGLPVGSQLVVLLPLLRIGQDRLGLVGLLEAFLGIRILVRVRVELAGQLAIGLLDLGLGGRLRNAEDRVVVLVLHRCVGAVAASRPNLRRHRAD